MLSEQQMGYCPVLRFVEFSYSASIRLENAIAHAGIGDRDPWAARERRPTWRIRSYEAINSPKNTYLPPRALFFSGSSQGLAVH